MESFPSNGEYSSRQQSELDSKSVTYSKSERPGSESRKPLQELARDLRSNTKPSPADVDEFFPGEEDTLAARGELLPEELEELNKRAGDATKISCARECGLHPCSKLDVYDTPPGENCGNQGHLSLTALSNFLQDGIQQTSEVVSQDESSKPHQPTILEKNLETDEEYYYEDQYALLWGTKTQVNSNADVSKQTIFSLVPSARNSLSGHRGSSSSSWELLPLKGSSDMSVSFSNELYEEPIAIDEQLRTIRKARVRKILKERGLNQVVETLDSNSVKDQVYYYCGEDLSSKKQHVLERVNRITSKTSLITKRNGNFQFNQQRDAKVQRCFSANFSVPSTSYSISRTESNTGDMEWDYNVAFPEIKTPSSNSSQMEEVGGSLDDVFREPGYFVSNTYYSVDMESAASRSERVVSSVNTDSFISCNSSFETDNLEDRSSVTKICDIFRKVISRVSLASRVEQEETDAKKCSESSESEELKSNARKCSESSDSEESCSESGDSEESYVKCSESGDSEETNARKCSESGDSEESYVKCSESGDSEETNARKCSESGDSQETSARKCSESGDSEVLDRLYVLSYIV